VLGLVVFTIALRLVPYALNSYNFHLNPSVMLYPWNFVPLMSVSLFCGAYVADRRWALGLPLVAQFIHQVAIWMLTGKLEWAFQQDSWSIYLCYALAVFFGQGLNAKPWPMRGLQAVGRGLFCEAVFFVVTNFAYFLVQTKLPRTTAGLVECYGEAIPFALKAFASTAFYSLLLFSPLAVNLVKEKSTASANSLKIAA
jgi:hypothetical protein